MSRLHEGEVEVEISGQKFTLRPTMRAADLISRQFGGFGAARAALGSESLDAIYFIVRVGTGLRESDLKNMNELIWKNGLTADLLIPLIRYVGILGNGGRPLPDGIEDESEGKESEGN